MIEIISKILLIMTIFGGYIYGGAMLTVGLSILLIDRDDYEELRVTGENEMFNYISDKMLPFSYIALLLFGVGVYNL